MKPTKEFPFEKARRIRPSEVRAAKGAIEKVLGVPRPKRGRPLKSLEEKYQTISIRLDPRILAWAKAESERRHMGYQTVINEILLRQVG